jgi:hypothetical protein
LRQFGTEFLLKVTMYMCGVFRKEEVRDQLVFE